MNPYDVLVRPILSEKSTLERENLNKFTFDVRMAASKGDVKSAVEKIYNVKVVEVNTSITRGKVKRRGNAVYKDSNCKKAVVTLAKGAKIPVFEDL